MLSPWRPRQLHSWPTRRPAITQILSSAVKMKRKPPAEAARFKPQTAGSGFRSYYLGFSVAGVLPGGASRTSGEAEPGA